MLLLEFGGERAYAFANCGVYDIGGNHGQRFKDKIAQVHEGMGDCEPWAFNDLVAIEQDVNVNYAVVICPTSGFCRAPELAFNLLGDVEQSGWGNCCVKCHNAVQEGVVAVKAPGLGFHEGREGCIIAQRERQGFYRSRQVFFLLTNICS